MTHYCSYSNLYRLCDNGGIAEAIRYINTFIKPRAPIPIEVFTHLVRECKNKRNLEMGRKVQTLIQESNVQHHAKLSSQLIDMFSSCGSIQEATQVFESFSKPHVYAWNAIICAYMQNGLYEETMYLYVKMQGSNTYPTIEIFLSVLKACMNVLALSEGRLIHSDAIKQGIDQHLFIGSALINMYSKCGSLVDSFIVFDTLPVRDSACWSAMICGCAQHGCNLEAFQYYRSMQEEGFGANIATYLSMLKVCASTCDFNKVRIFHMEIVKVGFELDLYIGNALVDAYSKCGSFDESCIVFDKLSLRSVVAWSVMIAGYLHRGRGQESIELFKKMQVERIPPPDHITYLYLIKACVSIGDQDSGHFIHAHIIHIGIDTDPYLRSSLVEMYAKFGRLGDAKKVFDISPRNDSISLAVMSMAYLDNGHQEESLYLLVKMMQTGIQPDKVLLLCLLKSCVGMLIMEHGRLVHSYILKQGFQSDLHIVSALIDMYARCGSINDAYNVFEKLPNRDTTCWNALTFGLLDKGHFQEAQHLFEKMQQNGVYYCDNVTLCHALKACAKAGVLGKGKLIHMCVVKTGHDSLLMIADALMDMYGKCGYLENAYDVFEKLQDKDVVSWSAIISAHVDNGHCEEAFHLFENMQKKGFDPDHVTFACMLKACTNMESKKYGEFIHSRIMKRGIDSDVFVGNAMVDMYAKMGDFIAALKVFERLAKRQVVGWNALIWGLSELDMNKAALQFFQKMQFQDLQPDHFTYVSVVKSSSNIADLSTGRLLHICIISQGFESNMILENTLMDMYAKCGSIKDACSIFSMMQTRSIVSWNTIMEGYGEHGHHALVFQCFKAMQKEGVLPDSVTFVCILSACSHGGLIQEAYHVYNMMTEMFGLVPSVQHIVCMVDTLGRAGCLGQTKRLIMGIPVQPDPVVWIALLGSCARCDNIVIGDWAFEQLTQIDPTNSAGNLLLSNIYSSNHMPGKYSQLIEYSRIFSPQ